MNIVERVVKQRIRELVNIDSMQFGFTPGRGRTNALLVVRRMQGIKRKSCSSLL